MSDKVLRLYPPPQSVTIKGYAIPPLRPPLSIVGGNDDIPADYPWIPSHSPTGRADLHIDRDPALPSQGYRLILDKNVKGEPFAYMKVKDQFGIRYGLETLNQILNQFPHALPALQIDDWPCMTTRGVLWDISRGRIPNMAQFRELIKTLSQMRINHLQLYTEHTYAYPGYEMVWGGWSPLTAEEITELNNYCVAQGITLAANQATWGHMEHWVIHPVFRHLAELSGHYLESALADGKPISLSPAKEESIEFIKGLLDHLFPLYPSRLINLNCDETWDWGLGPSKSLMEREGMGRVYGRMVGKLAHYCLQNGFQPMIWGDMVLKHLDALNLIPKETIILVWGYEPELPWVEWLEAASREGNEVWVCPGTSSWLSITGRTFERRRNITEVMKAGELMGVKKMLITEWGDRGHFQQLPITLTALAEAASLAWNPYLLPDPETIGTLLFGESGTALPAWIFTLGDIDLLLRRLSLPLRNIKPIVNRSALYNELYEPAVSKARRGEVSQWEEVGITLEYMERIFPSIEDPVVGRELKWTLDLARWAVIKALWRRRGCSEREVGEMLKREWERMKDEFKALWLMRSRPGGLNHSLSYFDTISDTLNREN